MRKHRTHTRRIAAGLTVLAALSLFGATNAHLEAGFCEELELHARERMSYLRPAIHPSIAEDGYTMAYTVLVSREYGIFGPLQGRVAVFVQSTGEEKPVYGYLFYYAREDHGWVLKEGACCSDGHIQSTGRRAIAAERSRHAK